MKKRVLITSTSDFVGYHSIAAALASKLPAAPYLAKIKADSLFPGVTNQYYNLSDGSGIYNRYGSAIGVKKIKSCSQHNN